MNTKISKIIIVGGGSSGWITASYLSKALGEEIDIQLIESSKISKIGVGEATIPSIKEELFDFLGVPEEEWMPECSGTFKLAIKFANWKKPAKEGGDHYYHSFGELPVYEGVPLSHLWLFNENNGAAKEPFDYSCYSSPRICDNYSSPKYLDGSQALHYAYHFDALEVVNFLKRWCRKRGVKHVISDLVGAELHENGNIRSVIDSDGSKYEADLFIDCSGFAGFLIDKHLHEPFISYGKSLLTDRAVAVNIPNDVNEKNIRPYTSATALEAGWVWEIPLMNRSGNGYVYSSHFKNQDQAEIEFREFFKGKADDLEFKHIKFNSGRRRHSWVKNCVSFGLSSSFLEPLESTGLYFVYAALYQFVQYFPDKDFDPVLRDKFNERVAYMVEDVKDFIVMHFHTSPRTDTAFWRANKNEIVIPESLKELLELQRAGVPVNKSYLSNENFYSAFEASFDRFWTNSNYQCIFNGVGYLPERKMPLLNHKKELLMKSKHIFKDLESETDRMIQQLPSHFDYLNNLKVKRYSPEPQL